MSESKQQPESDHDLLIRIDGMVKKIDGCLRNHLRHHWAVTMAILVAFLAALVRWFWGN